MKNIHVLSTKKPSKLLKDIVDKTYQLKKEVTFGNRIEVPLNIYITSDEEIKEGDWYFDENKLKVKRYFEKREAYPSLIHRFKIILTTDQDLIEDGVQAIDDEFLEWFVKNPSCEEIRVGTEIWNDGRWNYFLLKEEPKRKIDSCYNFDMEIGCVQDICRCEQEEPKQETLEEAAERVLPDSKCFTNRDRFNFVEGAKWQQEQMCNHNYILTDEQGHRVIKCSKCNHTQPI